MSVSVCVRGRWNPTSHGQHLVNANSKETDMVTNHELASVLFKVGMIGLLLSITRIIMKIGRGK